MIGVSGAGRRAVALLPASRLQHTRRAPNGKRTKSKLAGRFLDRTEQLAGCPIQGRIGGLQSCRIQRAMLTVCWNTCHMVRAGRRFCGTGRGHWDAETRKSATNIDGLSEQSRRELFAALAREQASPLDKTRVKLDYEAYPDNLPEREREVLTGLAAGQLKMEIAKKIPFAAFLPRSAPGPGSSWL